MARPSAASLCGVVLLALSLACVADDAWLTLINQAQKSIQDREYTTAFKQTGQALEIVEQNGKAVDDRRAFTYLLMGKIYQEQGLPQYSEPYLREAYGLGLKLKAMGMPVRFSMEEACAEFGTALRENQKLEEATILLKGCATPNKDIASDEGFANTTTLINALLQQSKFVEAENLASDSLKGLRDKDPKDSMNQAILMHLLAKSILLRSGGRRWSEANTHLRDSLAICQRVASADDLNCANIEVTYAEFLGSQRKFDQAITYAKHSYEVRKKILGEDNPYTATSAMILGTQYFYLEQYEEALPILQYVHATFKKVYGNKNDYMNGIQSLLAKCLRELGKEAEARRLEKETGIWVVK